MFAKIKNKELFAAMIKKSLKSKALFFKLTLKNGLGNL